MTDDDGRGDPDPAGGAAYDGPATLRAYDRTRDAEALWSLKRDFERSLGTDPEKDAKYAAKLDDAYREGWLAWVDRCVAAEPCVRVAEVPDGTDGDATGGETADGSLVGYLFLLPETHAYVWDAAVVNELFVAPGHRGTGLADALMARALAHARNQELPMDRVVLDVDRENERARAFYERHGFTHWSEMVSREL